MGLFDTLHDHFLCLSSQSRSQCSNKRTANRDFLIFLKKVTWETNFLFCANLGMEPLNLENFAEMDCVANLTQRNFVFK